VRKPLIGLTAALSAVALTAGGVSAKTSPPKITLSLSASSGYSAVWGRPHHTILLSVGTDTTGYAAITLNKAMSAVPTTEPTFTTDTESAGSPRWVMLVTNGVTTQTVFGYPDYNSNTSLYDAWGNSDNWEINGSGDGYMSYTTLQTLLGSETVTSVYVVADGDQSPVSGTVTDTISAMQYEGLTLLP
jgi:hypothetical protein